MIRPLPERSFLLYGLGITNRAVARGLVRHRLEVAVADDNPGEAARRDMAELGLEIVQPTAENLARLVSEVEAVIPAPGLPERHPLFEAARVTETQVLSEFDLAGAWDDRPLLAVTGTNGKTTVTTMIVDMLRASGIPTEAVGNTDEPLVAAIESSTPEVFVVEASSFRLAHSRWFRPRVGAWLNFAEDHLDVHTDLGSYERAKRRIWADQMPEDVAVANADDPVVMAERPPRSRLVTFGLTGRPDYRVQGDVLVGPEGHLIAVGELWRDLPHDRSNALAASAVALAGGADLDGVREVLAGFEGLAHRVQLVAEVDGVSWFDDSKSTAPHSTLSALDGFSSVVLIAGGRNKGLDLGALAAARDRVRAVVGIGEAAGDVVAAFPDRPSRRVGTMAEAVRAARELASPGDAVLLSPACASFDWYRNYGERGDDFVKTVGTLIVGGADPDDPKGREALA